MSFGTWKSSLGHGAQAEGNAATQPSLAMAVRSPRSPHQMWQVWQLCQRQQPPAAAAQAALHGTVPQMRAAAAAGDPSPGSAVRQRAKMQESAWPSSCVAAAAQFLAMAVASAMVRAHQQHAHWPLLRR
jgi:hypothetical protein